MINWNKSKKEQEKTYSRNIKYLKENPYLYRLFDYEEGLKKKNAKIKQCAQMLSSVNCD